MEERLAGGKLVLDRPAEAVARLRITNPERRNALDHEILDALAEALPQLNRGIETRCVLITGAPPVFSAGYDIAAIPEETVYFHRRWDTDSWRLVSLSLIVLKFILPFFLIMSRNAKRNLDLLGLGAGCIVALHLVDVHHRRVRGAAFQCDVRGVVFLSGPQGVADPHPARAGRGRGERDRPIHEGHRGAARLDHP